MHTKFCFKERFAPLVFLRILNLLFNLNQKPSLLISSRSNILRSFPNSINTQFRMKLKPQTLPAASICEKHQKKIIKFQLSFSRLIRTNFTYNILNIHTKFVQPNHFKEYVAIKVTMSVLGIQILLPLLSQLSGFLIYY